MVNLPYSRHSVEKLDTIGKLGSLFNSWGKIIFIVGLITVGAAFAYIQIFDNADDITTVEKELRELKKDLVKDLRKEIMGEVKILKKQLMEEQDNQSQRSDKRYKRAMEIAKDHEQRFRTLQHDVTYIQGKEGY